MLSYSRNYVRSTFVNTVYGVTYSHAVQSIRQLENSRANWFHWLALRGLSWSFSHMFCPLSRCSTVNSDPTERTAKGAIKYSSGRIRYPRTIESLMITVALEPLSGPPVSRILWNGIPSLLNPVVEDKTCTLCTGTDSIESGGLAPQTIAIVSAIQAIQLTYTLALAKRYITSSNFARCSTRNWF